MRADLGILRTLMIPLPIDDLDYRAPSDEDQEAAVRLLFSHLPAAEQDAHVAQMVQAAEGKPLAGLWGAYRGHGLRAAMLAQPQPGRTAVVLPPRWLAAEPRQTACQLLDHAMRHLSEQGVQLAQCLLETDNGPDAQLLVEGEFRHVSNLLYLVSVRGSFPTSKPNEQLDFVSYVEADHNRLESIIQRTYTGSLDCPEIDGVRAMPDVLEGYRSSGRFEPARWLIARFGETDIGCVLLTDHPRHDQWELIYMGVVPEARGRAWGLAIARHAQWLARCASRERMVLAVDAANGPAIAMYAAAGFVTWDHRSVFLKVL